MEHEKMHKMSGGKKQPMKVEQYLGGLKYPANKRDLTHTAKENQAPHEITSSLDNLPEREYTSPTDVSHELGKMM